MEDKQFKAIGRLCLIYLGVLLLAALIYYRERMLFLDAPWICFNIINSQALAIQERRYGSFITQIFPLIGSWLKCPLNTILLVYSASFNLFYLMSGIVLYKMKQYKWLLLLAFYFSLMMSQSYYWTNNEIHQGITWMFLLFGTLCYTERQNVRPVFKYSIFLILCFLAIFTHPLVLLVSGFLWVYLLIDGSEKVFRNRSVWLYSILMLFVFALKYYYSVSGWYDGGKIASVTTVNAKTIHEVLNGETLRLLLYSSYSNYWVATVLLLSGCIFLIKKRTFLLFVWVIFSLLGYTFLILIVNNNPPLLFYVESQWMPLSIICSITFVWFIAERIRFNHLLFGLSLIFLVRAGYIYVLGAPFKERLALVTSITDLAITNKTHKMIIIREEENTVLQEKLIMSWGLPIETLFLSIIRGNKPPLSVAYFTKEQVKDLCPKNRSDFATIFHTLPVEKMNDKYFNTDTTESYMIIEDPFR